MDLHQKGDRFVVLDSDALRHITAATSEVGSTKYYKAVTLGNTLGDTYAQTMSLEGQALKPWPPCDLSAAWSGSDIDLKCVRQDRQQYPAFWQPPLSESSESYECDIMDGSTVVRTLTSATGTFPTYTSAQQTADFGSAQTTLTFRCYQLSASVGRGGVAEATRSA